MRLVNVAAETEADRMGFEKCFHTVTPPAQPDEGPVPDGTRRSMGNQNQPGSLPDLLISCF